MNFSNICILGNDNRMDYVAQKFYQIGYDVCREISELDEKSIVVLPPPVKAELCVDLLPKLREGQLIYGGAISNQFMYECIKKNIKCIDYLKIEDVTKKNAILTARGIIKEAEGYKLIDSNTKCLVCGYGYCGKAISKELSKHCFDITVMVRKKELKESLEKAGYKCLLMEENMDLSSYHFIFNTVPALILDENKLKNVTTGVLLDIASAPGGTDFDYCSKNNIKAILSLGIPGKMYPEEAGEIIAQGILYDLNLI